MSDTPEEISEDVDDVELSMDAQIRDDERDGTVADILANLSETPLPSQISSPEKEDTQTIVNLANDVASVTSRNGYVRSVSNVREALTQHLSGSSYATNQVDMEPEPSLVDIEIRGDGDNTKSNKRAFRPDHSTAELKNIGQKKEFVVKNENIPNEELADLNNIGQKKEFVVKQENIPNEELADLNNIGQKKEFVVKQENIPNEELADLNNIRQKKEFVVKQENIPNEDLVRVKHEESLLTNNQPTPPLQIFVETLSGKIITIDAEPSDTVYDLKTQIVRKEGVYYCRQRLLFGGKELEDGRRLSNYRITTGATLNLVTRLYGGVMKMGPQEYVCDYSDLHKVLY